MGPIRVCLLRIPASTGPGTKSLAAATPAVAAAAWACNVRPRARARLPPPAHSRGGPCRVMRRHMVMYAQQRRPLVPLFLGTGRYGGTTAGAAAAVGGSSKLPSRSFSKPKQNSARWLSQGFSSRLRAWRCWLLASPRPRAGGRRLAPSAATTIGACGRGRRCFTNTAIAPLQDARGRHLRQHRPCQLVGLLPGQVLLWVRLPAPALWRPDRR